MTLLTVIQDAAKELALDVPSTVYSASDGQTLQMWRLLTKEGRQLLKEIAWEGLITVAEITTVATVEQTGLLPTDFDRMVDGRAMWNNTSKWRIVGPISPYERRTAEVWDFQALPQYWWLRGGELNIFDTTAGDTVSFEYISKNWVYSEADSTPAETFTADGDTFAFDEELLTLAVVWRWKEVKGLSYAEPLQDYQNRKDVILRDNKGGTATYTTNPGGDNSAAALRTWPGSISTT